MFAVGAPTSDILPAKPARELSPVISFNMDSSLRDCILALMRSYGTEVTSSETTAMRVDGELYHLEGRDMLAFITRMGQFCEREIPE